MTQKEVLGLLDKMTLTEKVGQLNQLGCSIYGITDDAHYANLIKEGRVGSFLTTMGAFNINQLQSYNMKQSRLGIPLLFCADIIHGVKTIFPTPLAESCSWDVSLARLTAQESAREASALGVRLTYAPMVDLARDARWGRVVEGSGEDVYLATLFSMARVKGFQGDSKRIDCKHLGACAKHFVCYGNAIAGKDYNSADMNRNTFFNNYLPPFVSAINAGVVSIMTAFSTFEGIPCTVNKYLIRDILRKKLRFKGVIVSDYASIIETVNHRFVRSAREAVIESSMNTVDIDMADMVYQDYLEKLVVERVIPEQVLNDSVKRVLLLKYNLGLFDNPYTDNTREEHELYSAYALKLAKICAEKSIVLLKNKNNALPLPIKSKALIVGSLAKDKTAMHGSWAYYDDVTRTIDLVDGLNKVYNIDYLPCFNKDSIFEEDLTLAINNIDKYDRVFFVAGEDINMAGEAASRSSLELSDIEKEVIVQFSHRTNKLTLLLINGRPLALQSVEQYFDSIVECWNLGTMAGEAVAEVLVGRVNPQGKLTMSFPRVTGQCPLYYNHENTGRPYGTDKYTSKYIDVADGALYPFGYGLTYSDITISECAIEELTDKSVTVSMIMRNDSDVDCIETAQLYASPVYSCPVAPVKQLVGFVKEQINARSSAVVTITVDKDTIFHYTQPTNIICHDYILYIGLSSNDTLSLQVTL